MIKPLISPLFWWLLLQISGGIVLAIGLRRNLRRGIWGGFSLFGAGGLLLGLTSLPPVAAGLSTSLEKQYPGPTDDRLVSLDMIVVLGGGMFPSSHNPSEPELSQSSYARVRYGVWMLRRSGSQRMVMMGGGRQGDPSVAEAMARFAVLLGVPEHSILVEGISRNTDQHPAELIRILGAQSRQARIGLVTSAWHMPRAVASFARHFPDIVPLPCDFTSGGATSGIWSLVPSPEALSKSTTAVQEWIGLVGYRLMWRLTSERPIAEF